MRSPENKPFGRKALARLGEALCTYDAASLAQEIHRAVQEHRAYNDAFDDFTLLVVCASDRS